MTEPISTNSIIVAGKDQVSCEVGGEVAILSLKNGVYYGLNPVAARVWSLMQAPVLVTALRDAILDDYDIDLERCERDLLVLIGELSANGLIDVSAERTMDPFPSPA